MPSKAKLSVVADTEYRIEKGIPITPQAYLGRPRKASGLAHALRTMNVGDSIFAAKSTNWVYGYSRAATHQVGHKFTIRAVEGGTRIWRTA